MSGELKALSRDLGLVSMKARNELIPIFRKTAQQVKTRMQDDLRTSGWFGQVAKSVDYDVHTSKGHMTAEIGTNAARDSSAPLAGIAYFGGARGGGGTVADPEYIMNDEADLMIGFIGQAAGELW